MRATSSPRASASRRTSTTSTSSRPPARSAPPCRASRSVTSASSGSCRDGLRALVEPDGVVDHAGRRAGRGRRGLGAARGAPPHGQADRCRGRRALANRQDARPEHADLAPPRRDGRSRHRARRGSRAPWRTGKEAGVNTALIIVTLVEVLLLVVVLAGYLIAIVHT